MKINQSIVVQTHVHAPMEKVWKYWTEPAHIKSWYFAADSWHAPNATNDLQVGGKFLIRMEAKDGTAGFDFEGIYSLVHDLKKIEYTLLDGRKVVTDFIEEKDRILLKQTFDSEEENTLERQKYGWQAILQNFKKHTEK